MKVLDKNTEWLELRPARVQRDFLTNTHKAHGYHCQPMTNANTHGWEILAPHDIKVKWDGIRDGFPDHVEILQGENFEDGRPFLSTGTGNGTITFDFRAIWTTDENHYLFFLPPSNLFIEGFMPMSAILRSDWNRNISFQHSWMITQSDKILTISKGTPLALIINYPKGLLEQTDVVIENATQEETDNLTRYGQDRENFYKNNEIFKWTHWYRDGKNGPDSESVYDKPYKPQPSDPRCRYAE